MVIGRHPQRAVLIVVLALASVVLPAGAAYPQSPAPAPDAQAATDEGLKLKYHVEYWVRGTRIDDFDFDGGQSDGLNYGWQRIKPFFGGQKRWFEFAIQGQDSRSYGVPALYPNGTSTYTARTSQLDFVKAFVKIDPRPGVSIKVGREQADGSDVGISRKLASSSNYGTVLKSFDLVSLRWQNRTSSVMGFLAAPVDNRPYALNRRHPGETFAGLQATQSGLRNAHRLYVVRRSVGTDGPPSETGVRAGSVTYAVGFQETGRFPVPGLSWEAEGLVQWGHRSTDRLRAGAVYGTATYAFAPGHTVFAGYNQASGDGVRGDGTTHLYDTLYVSGFNNWGYMGLSQGRNIGQLRLGGLSKIANSVSVNWAYYEQFLSVGRDVWYGIVTPNVSRPSARSIWLGREVDATVNLRFPFLKGATIALGYLEFFPGGYLATTGPHAHPRQFAIDIYGLF